MLVYRIVKSKKWLNDLSGMGAFKYGGRWNNKGTYMLYTSENSSLAYLETLVHFDHSDFPPQLYITSISIDKSAPVLELPDTNYPENWMEISQPDCKQMGDQWMNEQKYMAIKLRSAINQLEYNYLINPLHPKFNSMVKIQESILIETDKRLVGV